MCDSPYQASRSLTASSGVRASSMAGVHVGFANSRILVHGPVITFGQDAAAGEYRNAAAEILDDAEIMLDHKNRSIGRNPLDKRADAINVLVPHTGGRLVEQQHFRIERER